MFMRVNGVKLFFLEIFWNFIMGIILRIIEILFIKEKKEIMGKKI